VTREVVEAARRAQRPIRGALALLVCVTVALVGVGAFTAWRLYTEANRRYLDQAEPLRHGTQDLFAQLLNEQAGIRGYIISADPAMLEPYRVGRRNEAADFRRIAAAAESNDDVAEHLAGIWRQVQVLHRYFESQIERVRSGPAGRRRAAAEVADGNAEFNRFRRQTDALAAEANHVVADARRDQHDTFVTALVVLVVAGILAAGVATALLLTVPRRFIRLYRQEQAARRAAEQSADAARALAHVRDAVVLLDTDEHVRYRNPAAESLLGDDGLGATLDELRRAAELSPGPRPVLLDGRERWVVFAESDFDGGRVVVLRDVTDDRRLERLRADFVATAAHELRTPLAAVYGAARTLRRADIDAQVSEQFLEMIESESERLRLVMDQLLVSAQLDRDDLHVRQQVVDLGDVCTGLADAVRVRDPTVELSVDCPETEVLVEADAERLRQVAANLVDNAIKYSPGGGTVEIRVSERDGFGVLEVADQGLGIPADEQQRIFEKFYRLDPSMTRGIGGSGLGLYISRELVQQMGGELSVRSEVDRGSTFTVTLPLANHR
jgi:signal transduction histidine kinase